jgi:hypothetical protein
MIVSNSYFMRFRDMPPENDPSLIVDANAVKATKIALKPFQAVARRRTQIIKCLSRIKHIQLPKGGPHNLMRKSLNALALYSVVKILSGSIPERCNHAKTLTDPRIPFNQT